MSYLAKKEEKAIFPLFLDWVRALVPRSFFVLFFFYFIFLGSFLYKWKTVKKFVNKQWALAKILSNLNRKVRVATMAHPNNFSAAWKLSDYQIKCK